MVWCPPSSRSSSRSASHAIRFKMSVPRAALGHFEIAVSPGAMSSVAGSAGWWFLGRLRWRPCSSASIPCLAPILRVPPFPPMCCAGSGPLCCSVGSNSEGVPGASPVSPPSVLPLRCIGISAPNNNCMASGWTQLQSWFSVGLIGLRLIRVLVWSVGPLWIRGLRVCFPSCCFALLRIFS